MSHDDPYTPDSGLPGESSGARAVPPPPPAGPASGDHPYSAPGATWGDASSEVPRTAAPAPQYGQYARPVQDGRAGAAPQPGGYGHQQPYGATTSPSGGYGTYGHEPQGTRPGRGFAITSVVLGIIAVVTFFLPVLPVLLAIAAIVFGILGLRRSRLAGGKGVAISGIVTGSIGLLLGGIVTVFWLFIGGAIAPALPGLQQCYQQGGSDIEQQQCFERVLQEHGLGGVGTGSPTPATDEAV